MDIDRIAEASDQVLIEEIRRGRHGCYAELYERHHDKARAMARSLCSCRQDADDVTAEAFIKIFHLLCRGQGPTSNFSSYLRQTIRSVAIDQFRSSSSVDYTDRLDLPADDADNFDRFGDRAESETVVLAFRSLPERWQRALWLTEVEDHTPRQVADSFGQNPHGFSAMAHRARWGLRITYLEALLRSERGPSCPELQEIVSATGRSLTRSQVATIETHVAACESCRDADVVMCQAVGRIARLAA